MRVITLAHMKTVSYQRITKAQKSTHGIELIIMILGDSSASALEMLLHFASYLRAVNDHIRITGSWGYQHQGL